MLPPGSLSIGCVISAPGHQEPIGLSGLARKTSRAFSRLASSSAFCERVVSAKLT